MCIYSELLEKDGSLASTAPHRALHVYVLCVTCMRGAEHALDPGWSSGDTIELERLRRARQAGSRVEERADDCRLSRAIL
jgi:hypothetical protein